jgi:hypothetical protein
LHALGVEAERDAHGLDELRLGQARNTDEQGMTAGEHRDQRALDHDVLAEDHRADGGFRGAHMGGGRFRRAHDHIFQFFKAFAACRRHDFGSFRRSPLDKLGAMQQTHQRRILCAN